MDLFLAVWGYYSTVEKKVKKKEKGLFLDSPFSVSKKYADCTAPKPPLCKGRWHGEAVTEGLTQQKVTYSPILSAKS